MVYLCMAILGPLVVILILLTVIGALVYIGSLDYRSIPADYVNSGSSAVNRFDPPTSRLRAGEPRRKAALIWLVQSSLKPQRSYSYC